jgi:hypothetical protein
MSEVMQTTATNTVARSELVDFEFIYMISLNNPPDMSSFPKNSRLIRFYPELSESGAVKFYYCIFGEMKKRP